MIVPFEKKNYLSIWLLSNKDSYREAGILFRLHKSTVSVIFHNICELLSESRCDFIKWPNPEEQENISKAVLKRYNFPNCVGFIDGCHIQILAPKNNPVDFHNRKEVHSVVLQAVCDCNLKFTHIFLGQTGRAHDARVFRESSLGDELPNLVTVGHHILGDSAYTLSTELLTPYRDNGHLSPEQKKYNTEHSRTRAYIERAFGLLKGKFGRLKYLELHNIDEVSVMICAACVLHNFILINEQNALVPGEIIQPNLDFEGRSASDKRNQICDYLLG